jgi:hypothetical protein
MLRLLGMSLDGPALMLGDNMSVVLNTTVPSSVLKKKHNAITYHRVKEAIAARIMRFAYINKVKKMSVMCVEMLSIFRTDPEAYDEKKQKHLKRFYSKVVSKIELN